MHLKSYVDAEDPKVTQGAKDRYQDLLTQWKIHEQALEGVIEKEFKSFEKAYREANVPVLIVNLDSEYIRVRLNIEILKRTGSDLL